ncbi:cation:proton antiporter [Candidatus Woesearchaeota archaeon]|nr:cation:proton antiporter [Candidatus Woesearchaeota archaeon]
MTWYGSIDLWIFVAFLVVGYLTLIISRKHHLPEPLILIALGVGARFLVDIQLGIAILLCIVVLLFDIGAHFIPRKFDAHSMLISEFVLYSIIINSLISGILFYFLIGISVDMVVLSVISGCLISTCSQFEILKVFKIKKNRLYNLTMKEEHTSNAISMVICLILLSLLLDMKIGVPSAVKNMFTYFFVDIGVGIFIGLLTLYIVVKMFKHKYFRIISLVISLLTYFIAVELGGSGFLAILVLSLFFHNIVSRMPDMDEFAPLLRNVVYLFVYIALGYIIDISWQIVVIASVLFGLYLVFRLLLLSLILRYHRVFMTLDSPKGILAISVAMFFMMLLPQLSWLFSSLLLMFIFSITVSYIANYTIKDIVV